MMALTNFSRSSASLLTTDRSSSIHATNRSSNSARPATAGLGTYQPARCVRTRPGTTSGSSGMPSRIWWFQCFEAGSCDGEGFTGPQREVDIPYRGEHVLHFALQVLA